MRFDLDLVAAHSSLLPTRRGDAKQAYPTLYLCLSVRESCLPLPFLALNIAVGGKVGILTDVHPLPSGRGESL